MPIGEDHHAEYRQVLFAEQLLSPAPAPAICSSNVALALSARI
jgi:hypothetical protein